MNTVDKRRSNRQAGISQLGGFLLFAVMAGDAVALGPGVSYEVSTLPGQTFDTLEAAEAAMRAVDERSRFLERMSEYTGAGRIEMKYEAPRIDATLGEWRYMSRYDYLTCYPDAGSAKDAAVAFNLQGNDNNGCPYDWELFNDWRWISIQTADGLSGGYYCGIDADKVLIETTSGKVVGQTKNTSTGECSPPWEIFNNDMIRRVRAVDCPAPYYWSQPQATLLSPIDACFNPAEAKIAGKLIQYKNCEQGNPCDVLTGNKRQSETDIDTSALTFTRTYHSLDQANARSSLGAGWHHNYDAHLLMYGTNPTAWVDERGYIEPLEQKPYTDREFVSNTGIGVSVVPEGEQGWRLVNKDGRKEYYDLEGRMERIDDGSELYSLIYSAPDGRLLRVETSRGRKLEFSYNAEGQVERVEDGSAQSVGYRYDTVGNLIQVQYASGESRQYLYEDARFPHHLTGIEDENAHRVATWAYDDKGRAILSEHDGGADRVRFTFVSPGVTTVTNAEGFERTYQYKEAYNGIWRIETITDAEGVERFDYRVGPEWTQKEVRLFSKTDKQGNQTQYSYAGDYLASKTLAAGTTEAKTIRYEYDPQFYGKVSKITEPGKTIEFVYDGGGQLRARKESVTPW